MHHPQIYDLIATIEDYFLLSDVKYRCQIESQIYPPDPNNNPTLDRKGLRIIREINSGRIEINIFSLFDDYDLSDIQYFYNDEDQSKKILLIADDFKNGLSIEKARGAIREIIKLDRKLMLEVEIDKDLQDKES